MIKYGKASVFTKIKNKQIIGLHSNWICGFDVMACVIFKKKSFNVIIFFFHIMPSIFLSTARPISSTYNDLSDEKNKKLVRGKNSLKLGIYIINQQ